MLVRGLKGCLYASRGAATMGAPARVRVLGGPMPATAPFLIFATDGCDRVF